jgi:predicted RNase H-like HicB family nuclease
MGTPGTAGLAAGAGLRRKLAVNALHYSMVLQWSDEDHAYLVTLPEWADRVLGPVTHGDTYEEAVARGKEALEALIASAETRGEPLPQPRPYTEYKRLSAGQGSARDLFADAPRFDEDDLPLVRDTTPVHPVDLQ